jgi:hypothetical protein
MELFQGLVLRLSKAWADLDFGKSLIEDIL